MKQHSQGRRWLRVLGVSTLGLGALFLVGLFSLQGQQTGKSVLVQLSQVQGTQPVQAFVEDEFIVVLKKESRAGFRSLERGSSRPQVNSPSLQGLIDRHSIGRFRRQFQTARTQPAGSNRPDLTGHYKVRVPPGSSLEAALADFANDPQVERVEKIGIHPLYLTPNDSFYSEQWNHRSPNGIDSDLAWNTQTGNGNVVIAILDTGVHYQHADLAGNIWTNPGEIPGNGIDDDGNGYVDDIRGYDFMESATGASLFTCCDSDCSTADNDPDDNNGHGTHLAGIVAATTNNGFGVAGIAGGFSSGLPGSTSNSVKIMPLRIGWNGALLGLLCGNGLIRMDYAAEALHYVADQKARGINIAAVNASWGSSDSGGLGVAVDEVLASDVMIIHAAGNSSDSTADFLGSKAGVMSVAATDQNGAGADFTNFGDYVEISAPGVDILSLWVGPDPNTSYYATASGTSMSTPHVSAVAGLLESLNPGLTAAQKFSLMVANTKPYVNDGRNLGSGILNANLALSAAGPATPDFLVSAAPGNRIVAVGNSATYDLTVTALSGFTGTVNFSAAGLPFGAAASFSPGSVIGSGHSTMTVTTGVGTPLGTYPITVTVTSGSLTHSATLTLQVYLPGAALFVTTDLATQGTWKGVYGADGYTIANDATSYPAYAQVTFNGQSNFTWANSTTDVRALQKGIGTDRIASAWYASNSFDININLSDGNWHRVGFYCQDWGSTNERIQNVEILDAVSGTVLDSKSISTFSNGRYLIWNLAGNVKVRATRSGAYNAVINGFFFDLPAQPDFSLAATPSVRTAGAGSSASYNVAVTPLAGFNGAVGFAASGLPPGVTASFNPASVSGSGSSTLTLTPSVATPGGSHSITVTGTSGGLSHSVSLNLVVTVSVPAAAIFINSDTATQGTWKGVYGADGYAIANDATSYPAYAQVTFNGQSNFTWANSTTDVRALQKGIGTDRIASAWNASNSFEVNINLSDGNWHRVGFYCQDWGSTNERIQNVEILDAVSGTVLDSKSISTFSNGRYLIWNLAGNVKVRATRSGAYNAVINGFFFDLPAQPDFSLAATPSVRTAGAGSSASYNVAVTPLAGFNGAVGFAASGLPPGVTASFNPASVSGSGSSTLTLTPSVATPGGSHSITVTGTSGGLSHSLTVTLAVTVASPAGATFVQTNAGIGGSWKGVYGADGYAIANDATSYPAYAQVTFNGQSNFTWANSTTDVRALQKGIGTDRIASAWYAASSFDIAVNLTDGNWHQVALYCVDWATINERIQAVEVLDANGGSVLDSRNLSNFSNGQYLVWNLKGNVKIRLTRLGSFNSVASGLFFDLPEPNFSLSPSPSLRSTAAGGSTSYSVTVGPSANFGALVNLSASGLPSGAAASFNPPSVTGSGTSTLTVTTSLASPGGTYPVTITGSGGGVSHSVAVTLLITASTPAAAAYVQTDIGTKGTWKGVYGADGYAIANDATSYPAYAQVTFNGQNNFTWANSTTDVRALQKVVGTDRIASAWYAANSFDISINLVDGNWHQVALYCIDWGSNNERSQAVEVLDANGGSILDSRNLSNFSNGQYVVWNLKGNVRIRLTRLGPWNSVGSGLFFR